MLQTVMTKLQRLAVLWLTLAATHWQPGMVRKFQTLKYHACARSRPNLSRALAPVPMQQYPSPGIYSLAMPLPAAPRGGICAILSGGPWTSGHAPVDVEAKAA
jgi:hypothetical protein